MFVAKCFAKSAAAVTIFAAVALGQTTFGIIRGRVLDQSGAAVPGFNVAVTNMATNIVKSVTSNQTGFYEAGYLQPGTYSVTAAQAGFKRFTAEGIELSANAVVLVDVRLEVGEVSSSVTVEAGAPLITTEAAVISDVKTQKQYLEAPINQRGNWDSYIFNFMSMVPGAQPASAPYMISFAGTRYQDSEFTVDGITLRRDNGGMVGPPVASMESIREVKVDLSGGSAEFSTPSYAGVITKGGENKLHGSLIWYYNTAGLNARDFFASRTAFAVMNDYGFSLSGPVIRNKTFFSGTMEGFNRRSAAQLNLNLASQRVRKGDFSQLKGAAGNPVAIKDPRANALFPGGVIPADRLNATALKIQERFFPTPNFGDAESVVGNYRDLIKQGQRREQVDVRIDHQLSASNMMFGRLTVLRMPMNSLEGNLPTIGFRVQRRQNRNFIFSDTHTFRPTLINEFRFGLTRDYNPWKITINGPQLVKELGLTGLPSDLPDVPSIPTISISGFQGTSSLGYQTPEYDIRQWQDNLSWVRGRHTFKMGGEARFYETARYSVSPSDAFGNISFTGQFTGQSYADFLLGIPLSASIARSGFVREHRVSTAPAFFFQDDFKASSRLTIDLGLRYELKPPLKEKTNRLSAFDPSAGKLIVPRQESLAALNSAFVAAQLVPIVTAEQAGLPDTLVYTDKNNFAPRAGMAYKLTSDNKTVVRGAYGIFYNVFIPELVGGPYSGTLTAPPNSITNGVPAWQLPAMFPPAASPAGTASLMGIDPHIRMPYMQQWNLTLEREIWDMGLRASYLGLKTNKLVVSRNVNQVQPGTIPFSTSRRPFPKLSSVDYSENGGTSFYNGLVLSADRKFKRGLQYSVSHTWAKNVNDYHDETGTIGIQNAYDRRAERGDNTYTRRHRLVASTVWEPPFGTGGFAGKRIVRQLASGWSISCFVILQTGQYFHPTFSGGDPANTGASGGRPDRIGNGTLPNPTIDKWFDTAAFVVPPRNAGRFGNSGVNVLRGPGTELLNLGIFKRFSVRERLRAQIEVTFTNALNHTNFSVPRSIITSATSGVIQSTQSMEGAGPRTTRLGMRLDF